MSCSFRLEDTQNDNFISKQIFFGCRWKSNDHHHIDQKPIKISLIFECPFQLNGSSSFRTNCLAAIRNCRRSVSIAKQTESNSNIVLVRFWLLFVCNKLTWIMYKNWLSTQISMCVSYLRNANVFSLLSHTILLRHAPETVKNRTQIQCHDECFGSLGRNSFFFFNQNEFPIQLQCEKDEIFIYFHKICYPICSHSLLI